MPDKFYTVEEIAELIKIHPKTVQRYIREGRLKASKVGKSWRVSGHDLSTFTEGGSGSVGEPPLSEAISGQRETKVSAVIDIPVADTQESVRIAATLTAIANTKPSEYGAASLQTQYIMQERMIRVMLWGGLEFTQVILDSVAMLSDHNEG